MNYSNGLCNHIKIAQESPSIESLRPNHAFSHFLEAQNIGMREQIRKNIEKMLSSSIFGILVRIRSGMVRRSGKGRQDGYCKLSGAVAQRVAC